VKKDKAMKLVKALRSGEYKQGTSVLVDSRDRFCCLGVACNISDSTLQWEENKSGDWAIDQRVSELPPSIQEEYGFYSELGDMRGGFEYVTINGRVYDNLATANDDGCTFDQIADFIENNYENL
jgi:hypothetical protein